MSFYFRFAHVDLGGVDSREKYRIIIKNNLEIVLLNVLNVCDNFEREWACNRFCFAFPIYNLKVLYSSDLSFWSPLTVSMPSSQKQCINGMSSTHRLVCSVHRKVKARKMQMKEVQSAVRRQ